ncbi:MAG: beta-galactosidase [Lachnospiraceae bacterium]
MNQNFQWNKMTMGVCYYPEHWPNSLWSEDLDRMKAVGISTIRIAEFAWNLVEPTEGVFEFDFWDNFLQLCSEKQMSVIFGTPTATPPAWLTEKYPEVLNADRNGTLYRHGARRHYNYNSPIYQELSARIVTKLAEHYAAHPAIVGWQIDNEFNCEADEFYSEADSTAFRAFVKEKYQTLDALNQAWGTIFWNQTYTDWNQIYVPRPIPSPGYNPHLKLDYYRFISESVIHFCRMQANILRAYKKPTDFITTNGMFGNIDNPRMVKECLDVYTYDSYPDFAFGFHEHPRTSNNLNDRNSSKNLIEVRAICPHFGIMEQQSGANGWTSHMEAASPRPGQLTLWAIQSVAQGADYISFFRWRTCTFGTEMYWHGILDYDNRDNRKLAEVKDFYQKFQTLQPVCGGKNIAAFALLRDYDNLWDSQTDVWHSHTTYPSEQEIFIASELTHTPYDIVFLNDTTALDEIANYPVIFYPHPTLINKTRVKLLKSYVELGGTLILGCRSGYKDMNGKCIMQPQPGLFRELTGTDVRDFTLTSPNEDPTYAIWTKTAGEISKNRNHSMYICEDTPIETPIFNDIFEVADDVTVLATYANSYYADKPALTERRIGHGRTIHFGSTFSRENVKQLLTYTGILNLFSDYIDAPETLQLVLRRNQGKDYLFVLNYENISVSCELKQPMKLLYTGETQIGSQVFAPYATAVYELLSDARLR